MIWEAIGFYSLAIFLIYFAYKTISATNPVHSALYLVLTMMGLAAIFYNLGAHFIAGVQMIVYAGAVMVLFVMVLMLFDLKAEIRAFTRGMFSGLVKVMAAGVLAGLVIGSAKNSVVVVETGAPGQMQAGVDVSRQLGILLYTKYLYAFELLGVLLLVVAVGVVAVSRMKGGTHAQR